MLQRLFRMPLPELACRGRQEAFKLVERVHSPTDLRRVRRNRIGADSDTLDRFFRNSEERFFAGATDTRLPAALAIAAPEHCKDILIAADKSLQRRFDLLGYRDLDFGNPPDWHLDPVAGCRAPFVHWTNIDPLDSTSVGDSKVVWELNRHQWLMNLACAYRLTREDRYADAVVRHLQNWLDTNPPGMGINWTSSLEVAFRIISWSWILLLLRGSRMLTPNLFGVLVQSIRAHATHVERYLSYYFSPNTHLTGEALGLFYAGVVLPKLKGAERWRSLGARILTEEIERQVLPDGVYFERSTCYQRYSVDIYLHFVILAARAGMNVPSVVTDRLRSMIDVLVTLRQPDGSMPSIGDADGGLLLPMGKSEPHDYRAMFSTAAVVFQSPSYAWAAGEMAPETLWLLGTSAADAFAAIDPAPPAEDECRAFPAGGFAVMRSGWNEDSHALIFDTGPLGCHFSSGHGHADLLSIQCSVFGRQYLVDGGTCCYTASEELRHFSRSSLAHSTVMIDGRDHAETAGPFSWHSRATAQLLRWTSHQSLTVAEADHDGYRGLADPVSHRRQVIFVDRRYWLVIDDLIGTADHHVEIRFQFAPMDVRLESGWALATHDGRRGLMVRSLNSAPLHAELRVGRRNPLEGWVSPNYGQLEPAPVLVFSATTALPLRVMTLLWPTESIHEIS